MMIGQEADCRANENFFFHLKIIGDFESMCDSLTIIAYKKKKKEYLEKLTLRPMLKVKKLSKTRA